MPAATGGRIDVEALIIDVRRDMDARRFDELLHARAPQGAVEPAGDEQHSVANLLGIEPAAVQRADLQQRLGVELTRRDVAEDR